MILDTNALSAFFDGEPSLLEHLAGLNHLYLPVIVLGEYRFGLRASRIRAEREQQLSALAAVSQVLTITQATSIVYADIRHELKRLGKPIPENDIWIAALALEHSLPVITRDHHFDLIPNLTRIDF